MLPRMTICSDAHKGRCKISSPAKWRVIQIGSVFIVRLFIIGEKANAIKPMYPRIYFCFIALLIPAATAVAATVNVINVTGLVIAVNSGAVGDTINIAAGTYELSAALTPKAGMTIKGAGIGLTVLTNAASWSPATTKLPDYGVQTSEIEPTAYLFSLTSGTHNITISDLTLTGPVLHGALYGNDNDNLHLYNLRLVDFRWCGVRIFRNDRARIHDNEFIDTGGHWNAGVSATSGGIAGGGIYATYMYASEIWNNRFSRVKTGTGNQFSYYGIKGRQARSTRIHHNTINVNFSIELPFENDDTVEIDHNILKGVVSVPKSGGGPVPVGGYTFRIHHNYFTTPYSIEFVRNGIEINHNLFDFPTAGNQSNLISGFDTAAARGPGPVSFHNNLIKNPGRGVYWVEGALNNVEFRNNHIIANVTSPANNEGLFGFKGTSSTSGSVTYPACDFSTITIKDNIIEAIGQSRKLVRNTASNGANIQNNTLTNISDTANYPNPDTGTPRGPTAPLLFTCGVNSESIVDQWVLSRAPDQGPEFRWTFDETNGATVPGRGSRTLPLTLTGSPALNPSGQLNSALELNGTTQFAQAADDSDLDKTSQLTLSLWVRPANLNGAAQFLVSKRVAANDQQAYSLYFSTGNKLFLDLDGNGNSFSTNTVFQNNIWYHITAVYDGTLAEAQRAKIYVNGVLDVTAAETSATLPASTAPLFVGIANASGTAFTSGRLDDLRIYRTALSASEVANLATNLPAAATNFAATSVNPTAISLTWTDNSANETAFILERKATLGGIYEKIAVLPANTTSYQNTGLLPNPGYYYRLTATNLVGDSATSAEASVTFPGTTFANGLSADTYARGGTYAATNYGTATTLDTKIDTADFTRESFVKFNLTALQDSATTTLVLSCTAVGTAAPKNSLIQCATAWTETGLNWNSRPATIGSALGTWTAVLNTEARINITALVLAARAAGETEIAFKIYSPTNVGTAGNASYASRENTTTALRPRLETLVYLPSAPTNLTAVASGTTAINLTWTDNAINETGFTLERKTGSGGTYAAVTPVPAANATSYSDTGLSINTTYTYRLTATNAAGSSSASAGASATTDGAPPNITQQPANTSVAAGQSATFTTTATGTPAPTFQWKLNGVNISGATGNSYSTPATIAADDGASYTVVASNSQGTVTSNAAILSIRAQTLSEWENTYFSFTDLADPAKEATVWGINADPDSDGLANLIEYATNTSPTADTLASPAVLSIESDRLVLAFTRLNPATVDYQVEASSNLTTWTAIATLLTGNTTWAVTGSVTEAGTGATRTVKITDDVTLTSSPARFLRLRVSKPSSTVVSYPAIPLTQALVSAYGTGQDGSGGKPTSGTVASDKRSITLTGNAWKKHPYLYTVTAATLLEFTVSGTNNGEIIALALDNDTTNTNNRRAFIFGGSDRNNTSHNPWSWKLSSSYYTVNSGPGTYVIPVGTYFTGAVTNLGFIADDDALAAINITVSEIKLYEP